ncbi:MAG: trehalose-phosphatase [Candidatus Pacebacteria bacterium]|nr:trehalose-phosphatase [Candidatus Paceibacterota bacterium]
MKYVFKDLINIKKKLKKSNFILLLDFDLTLSPLVKNPEDAILPDDTRILLKKLSKRVRIAIITGRTIMDIKKRIKLGNITYIGNHGLEHETRGVITSIPLSITTKKGLQEMKQRFLHLKRKYPGVIIEDKKIILALHYRLLSLQDERVFMKDVKKIKTELKKYDFRITFDKKTFEVKPNVKDDKGTAALFVLKKFGNYKQVIYIGDSKTDEDAFRVLPHGVTIRVGKSKHSSAKYYVRNTTEVKKILAWILLLVQ